MGSSGKNSGFVWKKLTRTWLKAFEVTVLGHFSLDQTLETRQLATVSGLSEATCRNTEVLSS